MRALISLRTLVTGASLALLCACVGGATVPGVTPKARPASIAPPSSDSGTGFISARSRSLSRHYAKVQANQLARGLLRTGGGGPDTPYTDADILRNFERIAFYDEYTRNQGLQRSSGGAGGLRKWAGPVRIKVEFGASVPASQHAGDTAFVTQYAARLARITGHPITTGGPNPNFHVLVMGEDDRAQAIARMRTLVPNFNPSALALFDNLPRSIHCLVVAFSGQGEGHTYRQAIAFIRSEHPPLGRQSCVHEELAQGLGLANDSPRARPSIFNDDDEFALLTTHDEMLLRLLYNPALTPGMTLEQARPILARLIAQQNGPI